MLDASTFSQVIQVYKVDLPRLSVFVFFSKKKKKRKGKRKLAKTCHRFFVTGTSVRGNDATYLL